MSNTKKVNQEMVNKNVSETTTKGIVTGIKSFVSNIGKGKVFSVLFKISSISLTLDKRVHKTHEDVKTFTHVSRKEYRLNMNLILSSNSDNLTK